MIKKVRGEDMGKKYNIIYADPPWEYERSVGEGVASNHYPTLNIEELRKLPVKEIIDKDAFLFLWVTFPQLNEGISLFEAWGFKYKTCAFNWIKLNPKSGTLFMGLGFWTRSSSEICLLGIKGHPKRLSTRVWQVIMSERMRHSKKPDEVRKRIVELCGDLPRIELFARQRCEGWESLGNEIDGKDIRDALKEIIDS